MPLKIEEQIGQAIEQSQQVLIALSHDWNTDAVSSALALARLLENLGKKVDVVADDFKPTNRINFLPGLDRVRSKINQTRQFVISLDLSNARVDQLTYHLEDSKLSFRLTPKDGQFRPEDVKSELGQFGYDLVFTIGVTELGTLGRVFETDPELFYQVPLINIDSNPENENYGNINLVDIAAASCTELIHRIYKIKGQPHDSDTATLLLAGLIDATRSFRSTKVTPRSLDTAAELVDAGGRREEVVRQLYQTRSLETLKLWGRALARLKYDPKIGLVWSLLLHQDFIHAGAGEDTLAEVMHELMITTPQAELVGLIYEHNNSAGQADGVCVLVTSERQSDVLSLFPELKPQGSRHLARIHLTNIGLPEAEKRVLTSLRHALGKTSNTTTINSAGDNHLKNPGTTSESKTIQPGENQKTSIEYLKPTTEDNSNNQPSNSTLYRELSAMLKPENLKPIDGEESRKN